MKRLLTIISLFTISLATYGQKAADFRLGLGYPGIVDVHSIPNIDLNVTSFPCLSFEVPIPFSIKRREKISINPGIQLGFFKEKESYAHESGSGNTDLNHFSASIFSKFLYRQEIKRRSKAFIYFGAIVGAHAFSRTIGTSEVYSASPTHPYEKEDINKSGKDFFNTVYYGPVVGFQPNAKVTNRYKLSIEVAYLPNFITVGDGKSSGVQASLQLGFFN